MSHPSVRSLTDPVLTATVDSPIAARGSHRCHPVAPGRRRGLTRLQPSRRITVTFGPAKPHRGGGIAVTGRKALTTRQLRHRLAASCSATRAMERSSRCVGSVARPAHFAICTYSHELYRKASLLSVSLVSALSTPGHLRVECAATPDSQSLLGAANSMGAAAVSLVLASACRKETRHEREG